MDTGRFLGIDFGKKRIGLALSDETAFLATPLCTLKGFTSLKGAAALLKQTVTPYEPIKGVVLGLPLHLSGKESELSELTRQFAEHLKEVFTCPIRLYDERLTSAQVERTLKEGSLSRKKRSELTDKLAAAALLQTYLDSLS